MLIANAKTAALSHPPDMITWDKSKKMLHKAKLERLVNERVRGS